MRHFLQTRAWNFILHEGIDSLPVFPTQIIMRHGWRLHTYTEYAAILRISVNDIIEAYDEEGFVFYSNRLKTFVICYNDDSLPSVIRSTLMHEISHISLGHISTGAPTLPLKATAERTLLEGEAQGFVRRILCPSIILHDCGAISPQDIMHLCGVSQADAAIRSRYMYALEQRGKFRIHPLERQVESQFKAFLECVIKNKFVTGKIYIFVKGCCYEKKCN